MLTVREFLATLFGAVTDGVLEITYLVPDGVQAYPRLVVDWHAHPLAIPDSYARVLVGRNQAGYGVYFGVTVRREAKPPVTRTNKTTGRDYVAHVRGLGRDAHILTCFWADVDDPTPEAYARLSALNPSLIVSSGGGYHGYWILDAPHIIHEVDVPEIKWALKGIAKACHGDGKVAELARILRLPNTANTKPSRHGAVASVVSVSDVRYGYLDIIATYAKHGKPPEPPIQRIPAGRINSLPKWVETYLTAGAPNGERNATLFRVACTCKGIGMSESECLNLAGGRAQVDGLSREEAERTVASAYGRAVSLILPHGERHRARQMLADDHLLAERKKRGVS